MWCAAPIVMTLAILAAGPATAEERSIWPKPTPTPESLAAKIKPGMTCGAARKTIEDSRPGDVFDWDDCFRAGLDRYKVGDGVYLLLRYDHLRDPLNNSAEDRLSAVELVRFDELKPVLPADLFESIRLIQCSPTLSGAYFDPVPLIRCVNGLHAMGKKKALAALRAYVKLAEWAPEQEDRIYRFDLDVERVFLIARILFEPRDAKDKMPDMYWMQLGEDHGSHLEHVDGEYPIFPLVVQDDIPFMLSNGYSSGGAIRSPADDLDFCEKSCELRKNVLNPGRSPIDAVQAIVASPHWQRVFAKQMPEDAGFVQSLLRREAIRAVEPELDGILFKSDLGCGACDRAWEKVTGDARAKQIRWNQTGQKFDAK